MNINKKKKKRIGIDARFYGPIGKGLGRYTQEIVDNITRLDNQNEYVIFLNKENFEEFLISEENKGRIKKVLTNVRWYTLTEQIIMPFLILREHLDLMHFPHFNVPIFYPKNFVITIHDLILMNFSTLRATTLGTFSYGIKNFAYKIVIRTAIARAKKIIAVSYFTKNDIIKHFKKNPDKIVVTYEGVANLSQNKDNLFFVEQNDKKTLLRYNIKDQFLFYVGNAYPHKNLEVLLDVFFNIHKKYNNLKLVLVGKEDYFYKRIKKHALKMGLYDYNNLAKSPVIFTGYVPDNELEILYKNALIYVFPSLYEGFGLPPMEAMSRGCPVISSNRSSMPELLGDAVVYFDPEKKHDMQEKIELVIQDKNLREKLIEKGYKKIKKFSWEECAKKTIEVYNRVLAGNK